MSTTTTTSQAATTSSFKRLMIRHPLLAFFVIAFAGAWLGLLPLVLDTHGFGLVPLTFPDVVCFILAGLAGPTLASFVMTAVTSGKAGVRQLLRRYVLWRVGIQWYLLVLFGPPIYSSEEVTSAAGLLLSTASGMSASPTRSVHCSSSSSPGLASATGQSRTRNSSRSLDQQRCL